MAQTATTTWKRHSDLAQQHFAATRAASAAQMGGAPWNWEDVRERPALCSQPPRILIVDDDIESSSSLERTLQASGYSHTRVAYSGHAALAIAPGFRPSVVLLELSLLDMSGYEVARLLREQGQCGELRLIALTWSREHAGRDLARAAGFERYLLKPVASLDLLALLQVPGRWRSPIGNHLRAVDAAKDFNTAPYQG